MDVILQKEFVQIVEEELALRGWSRSDLARAMSTDRQYVTRYLNGHVSPGLDVVERFFLALQISPHFERPEREQIAS